MSAAPVGISCAACHAAHGAHGASLVRDVAAPTLLEDEAKSVDPRSRVCLSCHSPAAGEPQSASQAAMWLARGGLANVAVTQAMKAHAQIAGGCLGCHAGSDGERHGGNHTFEVDWARCMPCHEDGRALLRSSRLDLQRRETGVARRWSQTIPNAPHAPLAIANANTRRGEALSDLRLVLQDPSAAAHNAAYARALLDAAR